MIDTREQPLPILRCPTCAALYGPRMAACSRCGGPLVPWPRPTQLPNVPFATRDLPAGTYKRGESFAVESPNKIDL